jgi:hypothetical protein
MAMTQRVVTPADKQMLDDVQNALEGIRDAFTFEQWAKLYSHATVLANFAKKNVKEDYEAIFK